MNKTIRKIFDSRICDKIEQMKLLLVGVGGIGSEFLKNLITIGCKHIDIIDIDTIDITNLNRQFLFKRKDVKNYKSEVAKERALIHDESLNINAYTYDVCTLKVDDIAKYDYIINALDNIKARTYVNKLCINANKVLIESGSTGYNGQVYPIFLNETKCYNCEEKPKPKTFAICTIRQTPTLPEHCVAWGKLIFETFFCNSENETLVDIKNHIEKESQRKNMNKKEVISFIFNYLFYDSINELIALKKDFTTIPIPIKYDIDIKSISDKEMNKRQKEVQGISNENNETKTKPVNEKKRKYHENVETNIDTGKEKKKMRIEKIELSSQKVWNQEECMQVFTRTFLKLYNFLNINKKEKNFLVFDKDDDDCMNFITAASNLRMMNFSINQKSKFDIQSIAGNIIPAIASTNAVVAACQVVELIHIIEYFEILKEEKKNFRESKARHVWIKSIVGGNNMFIRGNLINSEKLELPNPSCYICQQTKVNVHIKSLDEMDLYSFVRDVCTNELGCLYPFLDTEERNIFDYDFFAEGDLSYIKTLYKPLSSWGIKDGTVLILTDIQNSEDQLEIHLKEDSTLETMYTIKHKDIQKKMKNKEDNQRNGMNRYINEEEIKKKNELSRNQKKETLDKKNEEIKLIVVDDDDDNGKNKNEADEDIVLID